MLEGERKRVDGCAIFWRASKFTLLKEHLIEFSQVSRNGMKSSWLDSKKMLKSLYFLSNDS